MQGLKETQLTQRATRRPCEYNYTNADVRNVNAQPADGYQFEYPVTWTGDGSRNKVIGLRRISYTPSSVNLGLVFDVYYDKTVTDPDTHATTTVSNVESIPIVACYTSENTFEECLADILDKINKKLTADSLTDTIVLSCAYEKTNGTFNFKFQKADGSGPLEFKLLFPYGNDAAYASDADFDDISKTYYKREYLKLFNQPITKTTVHNLFDASSTGYLLSVTHDNVWNRDSFYCHASFSDSPRKIIGVNKDFWQAPSVLYGYCDNSDDFNVYFTTDTVQRILPRNGVLLIQLSYIYNYQSSYLSY